MKDFGALLQVCRRLLLTYLAVEDPSELGREYDFL